MVVSVSPSVTVTEVDLTSNIPASAATKGAIAGVFTWGPIDTPTLITSESELSATFGNPSDSNYETFFVSADFLSYSNQLYVVRTVENANTAAGSNPGGGSTAYQFNAKYPGALGNALKVAYVTGVNNYSQDLFQIGDMTPVSNTSIFGVTELTFVASTDYSSNFNVNDNIVIGNDTVGYQTLRVNTLSITPIANTGTFTYDMTFLDTYRLTENNLAALKLSRQWGYAYVFGKAPATNKGHIVVFDRTGAITGIPGQILEKYTDIDLVQATLDDGTNNYYKTVINTSSQWITIPDTSSIITSNLFGYISLSGGTDGSSESAISFGKIARGYDNFGNEKEFDIDFILQGKANSETNLANYIIGNICEVRKDCVLFISPSLGSIISGAVPIANSNQILNNILIYRNALQSSSYWFMDSGYKYRYDKYNDVYRWVPMNGDMAGLSARVDPWVSPAGYKRGLIKNVVKLAFNPSQAQRDILFPKDVNPVISQNGQGTLLFGDKTGLGRSSAFDRINVRRLFIAVEKAIALASASILFDFNDDFTQTEFKNIVDPYLRDIKGKRGITDFMVVCDSRVNTPDIIDANTFRANIFIKPARSISFIELTFIATRTGVSFEELVGQQF